MSVELEISYSEMIDLPQQKPETSTVVSWEAPPWTDVVAVDEGYIRYSRTFGEVPVEPDSIPIRVEIYQYDNLNFIPGSTSVIREPAKVSLNGYVITPAQARDIIGMLESALTWLQ